MGSILCCCKNDSSHDKKEVRKSYSLKDEKGQFKTSAHTKEFVASKWEEDTNNIWSRPLSSLSCHMDLPRLGHKMKVFFNGEEILKSEDGSKMEVVLELIISIAENVGESPDFIETINEKYFTYVHEDGSGDISQQLKSFLAEVIPEESKLANVLCLCHQKIVFPAYYSIKQNIFDEIPFKDKRGAWVIDVHLTEEDCTVSHRKTQMDKNVMDGEPEFIFEWELVLGLQGEQFDQMKKSFVRIVQVDIRDDVSESREQEIRGIFENHYPPSNDDHHEEEDDG